MGRRNQSANSGMLIGIVVLAIIAGSAIFVAYDLKNQIEKKEIQVKRAETAAKGYEQDLIEAKKKNAEERAYVYGGQTKDLKSLELWMIDKFSHLLSGDLKTSEDKLKAIRQRGIVVTDYDLPDNKFTEFQSSLKAEYETNKKKLEEEVEILVNRRRELEGRLQKEIDQLQTTVDEQNVEIGRLNSQVQEMSENHQIAVDVLRERLNEKKIEIKAKERAHSVQVSRLSVEIDNLNARIDQETGLSVAQLVPDGEVINVSSSLKTGTVYINLGRHNNVTRGMRFQVFQWGHGGTQRKRGDIIVREVYPHTAKAGVINVVDPFDPIVVGDQIANIVYDPKKSQDFALVGSFEDFTKEELRRLIEKDGGAVSELVHAGLDYVVVGKFSDQNDDPENKRFKRATDLHIPVLNEKEIQRFLRDYSNYSELGGDSNGS